MQNTPRNPKKPVKKKKSNPLVTAIYVVGISLAVGGYVFTDASGYMIIPGIAPLSLAAVVVTYTWEHYQKNKNNRDGMLMPQMVILSILAAINIIAGLAQIYAAIVS